MHVPVNWTAKKGSFLHYQPCTPCTFKRVVFWKQVGRIICLVVSTHLKNISQTGSFPEIGMKIKQIQTTTQSFFITPCWQYVNGHVPVTHDQLLVVLGPSKMEHSHSLLICSSLSTTQILLFFGTHIQNQWTRPNLILDHWRSRLQPFNGSFQYGTHTNQRCVTCKHAGEINTPWTQNGLCCIPAKRSLKFFLYPLWTHYWCD